RILRMHRNTVVVGHLSFITKFSMSNLVPVVAVVFTPEHAKNASHSVSRERVYHGPPWPIGACDGQAGPRKLVCRKTRPDFQVFPFLVLVATPDATLRSASIDGGKDHILFLRVKHD